MNEQFKPVLRIVALARLDTIHPAVSDLARSFTDLTLTAVPSTLSEKAITSLLYLHPIQALDTGDEFKVIAGLRSYQLAGSHYADDEKVPVLLYKKHTCEQIRHLAETDLLASRILHSLGSKSPEQLLRLIKLLGADVADRLAPGLSSMRAIKRLESNE
jgi:hypothetical protein